MLKETTAEFNQAADELRHDVDQFLGRVEFVDEVGLKESDLNVREIVKKKIKEYEET